MTITEADIKRILDGTEGVSKGKWRVENAMEDINFIVSNPDAPVYEWMHVAQIGLDPADTNDTPRAVAIRNSRHIANCDPDTIRALCELALDGLKYRALYNPRENE